MMGHLKWISTQPHFERSRRYNINIMVYYTGRKCFWVLDSNFFPAQWENGNASASVSAILSYWMRSVQTVQRRLTLTEVHITNELHAFFLLPIQVAYTSSSSVRLDHDPPGTSFFWPAFLINAPSVVMLKYLGALLTQHIRFVIQSPSGLTLRLPSTLAKII